MEIMWKDEFTPHVLFRGKRYYEDGRVSKIVQYGDKITAHVDGTEDYYVEIELPGGVPNSWLCTCPYAMKAPCKHMAALMFAIEEGEYTFTGDPPEYDEDDLDEHPSLPWYDAVEKLPADILRRFLLDYADRNSEVREYLAIWYLYGLPEGLLEQWKENLQSYAKARSVGRQYVPEEEVAYFIRGVRSALDDRFVMLRKVGATMDAFYWLGTVFEIAAKKIRADGEGAFESFYYDCIQSWDDLVMEATEEQREQMYAWFWEHRAAFFAHANGVTDVVFLYFSWGDTLERKSLEIVDGLIVKCRSNKELKILMDCRVEIMDFLDCSHDEVWNFWKRHLAHDYARHRLLESYYTLTKEYAHIVPLLKQLKEMDADDLPRLIQDSVWLARMYKELGEQDHYDAEMAYLLTQCEEKLEQEIPKVLDKTSARRFIACLNAFKEMPEKEFAVLTGYLVDRVCSNPAIARKGIVEMINRAGYEWPKPYRFLH